MIGASNPVNTGIQGVIIYYNYYVRPAGMLEREIPEFLAACRGFPSDPNQQAIIPIDATGRLQPEGGVPYGTHVSLRSEIVGGQTCQYLDCGFIPASHESVSCVTGDTRVALADGSHKKAETVSVGDVIKGAHGAHKVLATNRYQQKDRSLYGINGSAAMISGFHPILTTKGWKVIDVSEAKRLAGKKGFLTSVLQVGDVMVTDKGNTPVKEIESFDVSEPVYTYNIKTEGNGDFFANGIVIKGFSDMEMHYE